MGKKSKLKNINKKNKEKNEEMSAKMVLKIFEEVDKDIELELGQLTEKNIITTCSKGCYFCCRQAIAVPFPEVCAIAHYIKKSFNAEEIDALKERTHNWLTWTKTELPKFIEQGIKEEEALYNNGPYCPLLVEESCSVYPVRPLICRGYYVTSDPRSCRPTNDPEALEKGPTPLRVPKTSLIHGMKIRRLVEMAGIDFEKSVLFLPQWLALEMEWGWPK